jgi:hypothetical protein
LTGGDLSSDPNRPTVASNGQLFVGVQSNTFYFPSGDLTRIASLFAQYIRGGDAYLPYDQYSITEATTNGAQRQLYGPGGLGDVRLLQKSVSAQHDSLFLGIAQVQEAMLMGFNADAFGDVVYSHALGGANPPLDPQLAVYDSIQVLLSRAIANMAATGATNVGPSEADLVYGGDAVKWTALAHTLKARYYMHTAEVRGAAAYASAKAEAALGIADTADDYRAVFSGNPGERNPWGIIVAGLNNRPLFAPNQSFVDRLRSRSDTVRLRLYFTMNNTLATGLSSLRCSPAFDQPIVTHAENLLIGAEAAYRTGDEPGAHDNLDSARALYKLSPAPSALSGTTLLAEILTEEYINDFQLGLEGWKLYRRTCFPNLPNRSTGGTTPMPGRFYYDIAERQTNTSIPAPGVDPNGTRNAVDPVNDTSDVGGDCLAGA